MILSYRGAILLVTTTAKSNRESVPESTATVCPVWHPLTYHLCFRSRAEKSQQCYICMQDHHASDKAKTVVLGYVQYHWRCKFLVSTTRQMLTIFDSTEIICTSYVIQFLLPVPMYAPQPARCLSRNAPFLELDSRKHKHQQYLLQITTCDRQAAKRDSS